MVIGDKFDRFEVITLPDFVDGEIQDVWWVRARASHSMPVSLLFNTSVLFTFFLPPYCQGVKASNKRIINMGKLQTVAYQAPLKDWQSIRKYHDPPSRSCISSSNPFVIPEKYGIREGPTRIIPLHQIGGPYFGSKVSFIC